MATRQWQLNSLSTHARHMDEFPGAGQRPDRYIDHSMCAAGEGFPQSHTELIRTTGATSGGTEALRVFHKIGVGKVGGNQPITELLLLDTAHIAESPVDEHHRHQWYPVTNGGGDFVAGIKKSAIAIDREHRHVRLCMLHAKRRGVAPAEIVLVPGRQERARAAARKASWGASLAIRSCSFAWRWRISSARDARRVLNLARLSISRLRIG